ncbi:hypothetical protein CY0110_19412 [Crocosphaera chwakensis CCY0110]|uniref:Uncharacterized protein n=1 Tax=Crocosphaera chwakensis CCY0110 TaxID=391612 RepID=A3IJL4_9CHRO|nr:hypothetical protein CY0110_19412 [Crocosphaera chwakensis CCY0110]
MLSLKPRFLGRKVFGGGIEIFIPKTVFDF